MVLNYPDATVWEIHYDHGGRTAVMQDKKFVMEMLKDLRAGIVRSDTHPRLNEGVVKIEAFEKDPRIIGKSPLSAHAAAIENDPSYKEMIEWERKDAEFQKPYVKGNKIDFRRDDKGRYRRQLVAPMDNKSAENIHDFLKTLRYRDKNTGDVVITEKGKRVIENAKKNAETFGAEYAYRGHAGNYHLLTSDGKATKCGMSGMSIRFMDKTSDKSRVGSRSLCGSCAGKNAETFDAESKYECARCGGHGSLCRGCSGLSADYPKEFGSCTLPEFPCPYCDATGMTTSNQKAKEFSRVIGYSLESVGEDILGFSLFPEKMHHSKEKLEKIKANKNKIMAQVANHYGLEPVDIEDHWRTDRWEMGREEFIERVKSYDDPEFLEDVMNNPQKWEAEHTVRNLGLGAVAVSALAYFLSRRK